MGEGEGVDEGDVVASVAPGFPVSFPPATLLFTIFECTADTTPPSVSPFDSRTALLVVLYVSLARVPSSASKVGYSSSFSKGEEVAGVEEDVGGRMWARGCSTENRDLVWGRVGEGRWKETKKVRARGKESQNACWINTNSISAKEVMTPSSINLSRFKIWVGSKRGIKKRERRRKEGRK